MRVEEEKGTVIEVQEEVSIQQEDGSVVVLESGDKIKVFKEQDWEEDEFIDESNLYQVLNHFNFTDLKIEGGRGAPIEGSVLEFMDSNPEIVATYRYANINFKVGGTFHTLTLQFKGVSSSIDWRNSAVILDVPNFGEVFLWFDGVK